MKKRIVIIPFLFAVLSLCGFEITKETVVVIGDNAPESTLLAAQEFAAYTKKICGIAPPAVNRAVPSVPQVFIGTLADVRNLPAAAAKKLAAAKSPDAFVILCSGNTLFIVGKDRVGELYGTYAFLDEKAGVRWFRAATAKDDYEYVPRISPLAFADFEIFRDPVFRFRQLSLIGGKVNKPPVNGQSAAVRQGFQIHPPGNYKKAFTDKFYMARTSLPVISTGAHRAFSRPLPETLFDSHPEYFALVNGKRVKGVQICISNPDVQRKVIDYIIGIYKTVPVKSFSYLFGLPDVTTGWCECDDCRKLDGPGEFDYINISTRFHKVVSAMTAEIYKKYPDAELQVWAYHTYRTIPAGVKYDPRVLIYYCTHGRCYGHALNDASCQRNAVQYDLIKKWHKTAPRMRFYEYATSVPVLYGCTEAILAEDLRLFRDAGFEGWKEGLYFADAAFTPWKKPGIADTRLDAANSNWQWLYVAGKLLWNPDLDVNEILADAESKYYGKAAVPMQEYHAYRRMLWNNSSFCLGYPAGDERRPRLLSSPGATEKLLSLLDQAEKLAGSDVVLSGRIKDDRDWLMRYWIEPNKKIRAASGKACFAPTRVGTIKIDGDPGDPEWLRAWHTDDFRPVAGNGGKNLPKTVFSLLSDENNLYFKVTADGFTGKKDWVRFFIIPPVITGEYYQLTVTADGSADCTFYAGKNAVRIQGVISAVNQNADTGVIEVKLPMVNTGKVLPGSLWKIHVARSWQNSAGSDPTELSLSGISPHNTAGYRGFVAGTPLLQNGTFEDLKPDGKPVKWSMRRAETVSCDTSNAVKIGPGGSVHQFCTGQKTFARKIRVTFRVGGSGTISVCAMRYHDARDGKARYKYKRTILPQEVFYKTELTGKQKLYACEYTIRPDEWIGLRFSVPDDEKSFAILDDVSVMQQ